MSKKKDPNYVAKVEYAIAEKYGDETIENPKANWNEEKEKEYLEQLKKVAKKENTKKDKNEKIKVEGVLINRKLINKKGKRKCPVCEIYSFSGQDDMYMAKYECCLKCYIQYVEPIDKDLTRLERWKSGWRPKNEN